ncbi:HAMP domain-containing sensor histidine kinase [Breznakia pachnodae]|uniref:histidine kinase n=1 Tax=Breznakia pachnodae TaxID=265178 RepID=A0ABU0DY40_9FIRM|nr:HAMP domain-containing sensor histidine kinase [Breznakia pachnodae]MDQ0359419.1 signal transduction histidine kinase [Breznakia pachnodae]
MTKEKKKDKKKSSSTLLSVRMYIVIFFVIAVASSCLIMIYSSFKESGIDSNFIIAPSLIGYLMLMTFLAGFIVVLLRKFSYEKPMRRLSEAMEQVTEGDYGVRIRPLKNNNDSFINDTYEDFNKMVEELNTTETLKSDFIANVSHEIKTPLSVIQSYALALQDDKLSESEKIEYTETIISASKKLSNLVGNILKLNKLENQEITAEYTTFDLSEQLRFSILAYEDLWEKKNITIQDSLDEVMITSDEGMLELVWNNLISNAIKFSDDGGTIKVSLQEIDDAIVMKIRDNGCGISSDTRKHIFDKFYQGDTSHSQQGNGLGLSLVKKVVDILGGSIEVNSILGKGTQFIVTLYPNKQKYQN